MAHPAAGSAIRQLGTLFENGSAAGLSDRQLLERFGRGQGGSEAEAAFAALVARHGPMVLWVCQQILGDHHLAEDAFQAVFLVLARRARSLRDPDLLGNWLHGVALRTARYARGRRARQQRDDGGGPVASDPGASAVPDPTTPPAEATVAALEEAEALHGEIEHLPGPFRRVVVLCYLEGLTVQEAARRLRWPHGTVRSRLARAREKLRLALMRRGVALSETAMAGMLAPRLVSAPVSSLLCDSTTRAATQFAARNAAGGAALSAPAAALAQEVLRTMLIHKLKVAAFSLFLLAAITAGAGWFVRPLAMGDEPKVAARGPARVPAPSHSNAAGRMTVIGRVLDPSGQPVPGASIMVYGAPKQSDERHSDRRRTAEVDQNRLAADGDYLSRIDPDHYANLASDAQGRITFPALIPGATYRVNDMTTINDPGGQKNRRTFVAQTGEAVELGDILIEHP